MRALPSAMACIVANGGRVLNVTAMAKTVTQAREKAYAAVDRIDWPEGFCRRDIGWRAVEREKRVERLRAALRRFRRFS